MHEIICPHCRKAFKIDEAGYADILKQVRDKDFDKQLHERLQLAEQDKRNAIQLAEAKSSNELQKAAAVKDAEIQGLKARLDASEAERKIAVTAALSKVEKQRDELANELEQAKREKQAALKLADVTRMNERAEDVRFSLENFFFSIFCIERCPSVAANPRINRCNQLQKAAP